MEDRVEHVHGEVRPAKDEWESIPPMPTARWAAGAASLGKKIYVVGGYEDDYGDDDGDDDDGDLLQVESAMTPRRRCGPGFQT